MLEKTPTYILLFYIFLTAGLPRCLLRARGIWRSGQAEVVGRMRSVRLWPHGYWADPTSAGTHGKGEKMESTFPITLHHCASPWHQPALLPLMRLQFPRQTEEVLGHGIPNLWDIKVQWIERRSDKFPFTISLCSRVFLILASSCGLEVAQDLQLAESFSIAWPGSDLSSSHWALVAGSRFYPWSHFTIYNSKQRATGHASFLKDANEILNWFGLGVGVGGGGSGVGDKMNKCTISLLQ